MASQADIAHHYDVDNDFFALFLDKKYRAYSCGVWKKAITLEQAQEDKFDRLCRYANVTQGHDVIEIGCGWGGLMNTVLDKYPNTSVHGLTLSTEQFEFINSASRPNLSLDLRSWQDYIPPERKFDSIISIGAFEHFASFEDQAESRQRDIYKTFFDWCLSVSTSEAQIGLQTIVIARAPNSLSELRDSRYLLDKVFPGSALPSISDIQAAIVDKYEISAVHRIGLDYARTLFEWNKRLEFNQNKIVERYGQELFDHYRTYFDAARRSFETGYVDLYQVSLRRAKPLRILSK
ncbi:SAM-dependent methyltransferase [Methylotenera versatilis]|uniref:Cyclopropane-fatty-acyl-phospholipid synthase n=1 Tax=Methylotenera versatilis (strain 301) TaxID=666681 RepID=D7DPL1_METV0|nr:cyclopropane-fatty-acyl-phospholipid synthase family protein [Methylotenera versatilis]ADI29255.1 Cyclopropane-fatty-acyl-phospholipid synthase [Methylotenera versatilis 301]